MFLIIIDGFVESQNRTLLSFMREQKSSGKGNLNTTFPLHLNSQQIHNTKAFPALRTEIINILNTDILLITGIVEFFTKVSRLNLSCDNI